MYSRFLGRDSWDQENMERQTVFRINDNGLGPELLTQVFLERGWIEYDEEHHGDHGWHIWWRTTRFRTSEYSGLLPWQRINHFPSCGAITRKDALCRNFRKMRIVHGPNVYSFSPQAYNLPNDYTKFVSEYAKLRNQAPPKVSTTVEKDTGTPGRGNETKSNHHLSQDKTSQEQQQQPAPLLWICKPAESSRGRGIFIFQHLSELQYDCNAVVQQYISDPLLIGGYKFDIRVYVAVPSFNPFQVYIHEEGLVRFSTEKYDLERPDNVFAHLTNTSINKFSPGYTTDKEEVGHGCKWTISQLRRYFLQNNMNDSQLWQRVTNIIILTLLIQAPSAPKITNCFELYGFDILVDTQLRPWLLEVNVGPALSSDCQADLLAKKSMLHDLFDMVFADPAAAAGGDSALFSSQTTEMGGANANGGGVGGLGLGRDFIDESEVYSDFADAGEFRNDGTGWPHAGLGSLEGLTDRTATSLNSPRRSSRSNITGRMSGLSGNTTLRPSGSVHALSTSSASSNPSRLTHKRLSENGAFARNANTRNNHTNNNNNSHRKGSLRDQARRRSFRADRDPKGSKSKTDRKSPNFLLPPANPLDTGGVDSLFEEDYSTSEFHGKSNLNSTRVHSMEDTSLPELFDKALIAPPDSGISNGDRKNSESHVIEARIQNNEAKTSNNSDSGLSSLSQSSGENSGLAAPHLPNLNNSNIVNDPGVNLSAENTGSTDSKNSGYFEDSYKQNSQDVHSVGTELMRKLSELPQRQQDEDKLLDKCGVEENETRPVLVHGNMKRLGIRRLLLPSPDRGFASTSNNNHKSNSNTGQKGSNCNSPVSAPLLQRKAFNGSNSSLHTSVSLGQNSNSNNNLSPRSTTTTNNGTSRRQNPRQQLQQRQTASCYSHPADEKQARLYAIPRNFSRTEAARFPHSYQHGRHRHENIKTTPGTPKMPSRKIGRFFLVFPFSDSTHRLSQGKLDAKAIIKEVQRHMRENLKRNSHSNGNNDGADLTEDRFGQNGGVQHIWSPLKSGDVFDY